jgi:hypothetical protein
LKRQTRTKSPIDYRLETPEEYLGQNPGIIHIRKGIINGVVSGDVAWALVPKHLPVSGRRSASLARGCRDQRRKRVCFSSENLISTLKWQISCLIAAVPRRKLHAVTASSEFKIAARRSLIVLDAIRSDARNGVPPIPSQIPFWYSHFRHLVTGDHESRRTRGHQYGNGQSNGRACDPECMRLLSGYKQMICGEL